MVNLEWPAIRTELDGGQLSILGLVKVIGLDPKQLALNHQVVAYGYDLEGTTVTLRIYDPNHADDEEVTLQFDTADPRGRDRRPSWSEAERDGLLLLPRAVRHARPGAVPLTRRPGRRRPRSG